ncbi:MAG: hypothetical protein ACRDHF_13165, partial [Tepidiformaceae bacterium]
DERQNEDTERQQRDLREVPAGRQTHLPVPPSGSIISIGRFTVTFVTSIPSSTDSSTLVTSPSKRSSSAGRW